MYLFMYLALPYFMGPEMLWVDPEYFLLESWHWPFSQRKWLPSFKMDNRKKIWEVGVSAF
jgi:hypothetical protein